MHGTDTSIDCTWLPVSQTVHHPQVYDMRFPRSTERCPCPFPGYLGSSHTWNGLRSHLNMQYWEDRIRILEEHHNTLPRCERCESQVLAVRLNNRHYMLEKFNQGKDRRLRRKTLQLCFEASRVSFQINADTLPPSEAFPYLGRTITYNNSNWAVVCLNLQKVWRQWGMIARVLERTGATVQAQGSM